MTTATIPPVCEPVPVPLRDVEFELTRQLKALQGTDDAPVQRVCMSNLVIYCTSKADGDRLTAEVPEIVNVHPARVLLLIGEQADKDSELTASVCVRSRRLGKTQLIGTEQITLHAAGGTIHRLPFAVRSLAIGDLPTNLLWACNIPPPLGGTLLYELEESAQQIIYDSLGWLEPPKAVSLTASWLEQVERVQPGGRWRVASDLNWRRLKWWRRLVSQAIDPATAPGAEESITEIHIEHGPHAVIQAWELVSWLSNRLGWDVKTGKVTGGKELAWNCTAPNGSTRITIRRLDEGPPEIRKVRLVCQLEGKVAAINMIVEAQDRLAILLEGVEAAPRTQNMPPSSPGELIGRQLSDRERDPVFLESMAGAQVLARSVMK